MTFTDEVMKSNTDEWLTPRYPVELIVPYLRERGYRKVLCPFDRADSNFVTVLLESGFEVTSSCLQDGVDFFGLSLEGYDVVVSNPPFSKRDAILTRLFEAGVPFALILNFNGLFDKKLRWELFKNHPFELLIPQGRWQFINVDGKLCKQPNVQSIYVCSKISDKQIDFIGK